MGHCNGCVEFQFNDIKPFYTKSDFEQRLGFQALCLLALNIESENIIVYLLYNNIGV